MGLYILLFISAAASFLSGGINGAIILSSAIYKQDIRTLGSGNPGFTNFKRVYGLNSASVCVLLIDYLKTALPVFCTAFLAGHFFGQFQLGAAFSGLFCMLGHCFPVWYGFKGGKAFIAGFATIWFVDWRMAIIATTVFFVLLFSFHYMSLASCVSSLVCPLALAILGADSIWVCLISLASALLVVVRHKDNIKRLLNGTESKFTIGKKDRQKQ